MEPVLHVTETLIFERLRLFLRDVSRSKDIFRISLKFAQNALQSVYRVLQVIFALLA